jgi:hypothetical protein
VGRKRPSKFWKTEDLAAFQKLYPKVIGFGFYKWEIEKIEGL